MIPERESVEIVTKILLLILDITGLNLWEVDEKTQINNKTRENLKSHI